MPAILDNPIWNAAITGSNRIVSGNDQARFFNRNMAIFSAMPEYDAAHFAELAKLTPPDTLIGLFTAEPIAIPYDWVIALARPMLQMVYEGAIPAAEDISDLVPLSEEHIPAMTALTSLTRPGPWLPRTIDFGNYEGIFEGQELVAMCGQRLQPDPYSEISAVCVHPSQLGKGYAKKLIRNQLRQIIGSGRQPMLHLFSDNHSACKLYENIGFTINRDMMVYMIKRK